MKFIVKTQTTYECVYIIDAASEDEARDMFEDDNTPPDFYQKCLGETLIKVKSTKKGHHEIVEKLRHKGYY